mmetsp:Transcript_90758/g.236417  ORF Transcript_90758/g.236417 Transcript_90758/m.236417 type:complete len:211 (-) Transcript_90758:534-1166(-)
MHFRNSSSNSLFCEYCVARRACSMRAVCCSRAMEFFRCWIACTYLSSASLPSPPPLAAVSTSFWRGSSASGSDALLASARRGWPPAGDKPWRPSGVLARASSARRAPEPAAGRKPSSTPSALAGRWRSSPASGASSAGASAKVLPAPPGYPPSVRALVVIRALYAEERARSAAARRILFCLLAPLIWSSRKRLSLSKASDFAFHLSTSFL